MTIDKIEQKVRAALVKHNLKLYPSFYFDSANNECCVIGAILLGEMDQLPEDFLKLGEISNIIDSDLSELEAGFMGWRESSNGRAPELFALGQKFRSEVEIRKEDEEEVVEESYNGLDDD